MRGRDIQIALVYNIENNVRTGELHDLVALQSTVDSARSLSQALRSLNYPTIEIAVQDSLDTLRQELNPYSPEDTFIFNYCDAFTGRSTGAATITHLFEELGFKHTGSSSEVIELCTNKAHAKEQLIQHNIPTPAFQVFDRPEGEIKVNFPIIVKPNTEAGSLGINLNSVVTDPTDLFNQIRYILSNYDQTVLVEEFIPGREFAIAMWGNDTVEALPVSEEDYLQISDPLKWLLTYEAKWLPESPYYQNINIRCPAFLTLEEEAHIINTSLATYRVLNIQDFGRVDIRYHNHIPYVIDINELPDLSLDSGFPRSAAIGGYSYTETVERILDIALRREGWR